jgi:hypothetical protein
MKIYFLKSEELALLLAIGGLDSLYGIKLNTENTDKKTVYGTMFNLQKQGVLEQNSADISITPDINEIIEDIKGAKYLIISQDKSLECPQRFIYLGEKAVSIAPYGANGDMLQLETIAREELAERLCEEGFKFDELVSDETLYNPMPIEDEAIKGEATGFESGKWGNISHFIKLMDIKGTKCLAQYLLLNEGASEYIAATKEGEIIVYAYSHRLAKKLINESLEVLT